MLCWTEDGQSGGLEVGNTRHGSDIAYNDRDIQDHVWDIACFVGPERVDQLAQRSPKRIRQTCNSSRADSPSICEPSIAVSRRCTQTEWLGQTNQYLAKQDHSEMPTTRSGARISYPIADQDEYGCSDNGRLWAAFIEGPYHCWTGNTEREEEARAQPIDGAFAYSKVVGGGLGDGREREPLSRQY